MGTMRICKECGRSIYSVATVDFGNNHFCEPCADELGLEWLSEYAEDTCNIEFCDPRENQDLYLEQLKVEQARYDMLYHTLKCEQLK